MYREFNYEEVRRETLVAKKPVGVSPECDAEESPVQDLITRLAHLLDEAHNSMSSLENRLEPIRASSPSEDSCKPCASMPTQIEQRLFNLLDGLGGLQRRIENTRDELRN